MTTSNKLQTIANQVAGIHDKLWTSSRMALTPDVDGTLIGLNALFKEVKALAEQVAEQESGEVGQTDTAVEFTPALVTLINSMGEHALDYAARSEFSEYQVSELERLATLIKHFNRGMVTMFSPGAIVIAIQSSPETKLVITNESTEMHMPTLGMVSNDTCNVINAFADAVIHMQYATAQDGYEIDPLLQLLFALQR